MRRLLYSSISALVLLLDSSAMSAPPPPEPQEPAPQKDMREQANRLVKEGRLADARDLQLSLWRLNGRPSSAYNVGMLSARIRDFATAAEYLTIWLDLVGSPEAPKVPKTTDLDRQYERARVDLQGALKQVEAIRVNVSDPGADVLVDNQRIGVSPLKFPVFVTPGRHRVVAQLGGVHVEEVVAATAGGERTVRLMLPGTPAAVTATTRADKTGGTPLAVAAASTPNPWKRWLPVGGLAASSVALGIFGGFAVTSANSAADERRDALVRVREESSTGCPGGPACKDFTAADGRAKTMTALSVGAFIGAGLAAAGAGAALYVLAPKAPVRVGSAPDALVSISW